MRHTQQQVERFGLNFGYTSIPQSMREAWKRQSSHLGRNRHLIGVAADTYGKDSMLIQAHNGRRQLRAHTFRAQHAEWFAIVEVY